LSLAFERPPLVPPRIIAVSGMVASGKSRTAAFIGELLSAPVVSSDRTRKHLMGSRPEESLGSEPWSGAYSPSTTEAVYREVLSAAETVVASGRPVVIDASFRSAAMRAAARELATRRGVPFTMIECVASRDLLLERLAKREAGGVHESDARTDLLDEFEARFQPMDELPKSEHVRLDTSAPAEVNQRRLEALLKP
jgi:predicted kinase